MDSSKVTQPAQPVRSLWRDAWQRFQRDRLAVIAVMTLILMTLACLLGPLVYSASPSQVDYTQSQLSPSWDHPFGTNDRGQDLLARVLSGGRISLAVGLTSMIISISLGTTLGAIAGFYGGWIDGGLMRLTDLFLALPQLPLLLLIIFLFREPVRTLAGAELGTFILIVGVIGSLTWMPVARLVRAGCLSVRETDYVLAARALGASNLRLIWIHIIPNVISPIIVAATLSVGTAIITESTLSFLGLGFSPDIPTWGRLLYESRNYLEFAAQMALFPGLAIFLTVLSINLIGDGLRDALDPRSRR